MHNTQQIFYLILIQLLYDICLIINQLTNYPTFFCSSHLTIRGSWKIGLCAQTHSLHASSLGLDSNRYAKSCRPLFRLDSVLHLSSVEENVVFVLKTCYMNSNNTFVVMHFISLLLLHEKVMQ